MIALHGNLWMQAQRKARWGMKSWLEKFEEKSLKNKIIVRWYRMKLEISELYWQIKRRKESDETPDD